MAKVEPEQLQQPFTYFFYNNNFYPAVALHTLSHIEHKAQNGKRTSIKAIQNVQNDPNLSFTVTYGFKIGFKVSYYGDLGCQHN